MRGPSKARLKFESLENRHLLAASSIVVDHDIIHIRGTNDNDVIEVAKLSGEGASGDYKVTVNEEIQYVRGSFIQSIEISGRDGNDQITIGDSVTIPAYISAGKGNDIVQGGSGDDVILGEGGGDVLLGGAGDDLIDGGGGADDIQCGAGDDIVTGGKGNDFIQGGTGHDSLNGDKGKDEIYGDQDEDVCDGGRGADIVSGGDGADLLSGGGGNDGVFGGDGEDSLLGGNGRDNVFGDNGADFLDAGAGVDQCHGGAGEDGVFGGGGKDMLFGDDDSDHLDGGNGVDQMFGGFGDDQLKGGLGKDQLDGGDGANLLDTDNGSDVTLNGLVADLDVEFRAVLAGVNGPSFVEYDVQNVNGQVETTLRIDIDSYFGSGPNVDLSIDGVPVAALNLLGGSGELELSSNPDPGLGQLAIPNDLPTIHEGSTVLLDQVLHGVFVSAYIV